MKTTRFDVIVIGSGPGGEGAAMKCAKDGKRVAVVESHAEIGGACTHFATIPSKAIRQAVSFMTDVQKNPLFQKYADEWEIDFQDIVSSANSVIARQVRMRKNFYDRNDVDVLHGRASFIDAHAIEVDGLDGKRVRYEADAFVIAVGSRPYRPPNVDFSHPRIFDSDTILKLGHTPNSMTVYGAGVIGTEYATIFRNLGVKVNLVNTRDKLLSFLDEEISDALAYHLRDEGMIIRNQEEMSAVIADESSVTLELKSGKKLRTDVVLWANGRSGNTHDLGLENIGLEADARGNLSVDEHYRTKVPHIYAVGDVVGFPSLASAAYDQGRFAATHLIHGECEECLVKYIPTGIYTSPEISSVGPTEQELTAARVPYEVGHAAFRSLARAQITGKMVGMLKLLFHRETLEVLAIHCFGEQASEIVHIGQAIMTQPRPANTLSYFVNTTFNYPTMAEAYRVAALNGINRIKNA